MARPRRNLTRGELFHALERAAGNRRAAGEILGVAPATLYRYLDQHHVDGDALRLVGERYESQECLGIGSHAVVLRARDASGQRGDVAIKLYGRDAIPDERVPAFLRRLRALVPVRHPSLVRVLDGGLDRPTGRAYLAMSLARGTPPLEACRDLERGELVRAMRWLLEALAALHARGVAHGHLANGSVLVQRDGACIEGLTLLEPDLAGLYGPPDEPRAGAIRWAPERLLGADASPRSDLYELGLLMRAALGASPAAPEPVLEGVVGALLAEDPGARPADAIQAAERLADADLVESTGAGREREIAFVGRDSEIDELLDWCRAADALPIRLVRAEGGLGKSRFLEVLLDRSASRGVHGALGECREGADALAPIAQILDALLGPGGIPRADALRARYARALAAVAPHLAPGSETTGGPAKSSRFHVLDGIASLLTEAASDAPILLAFDDFHRADVVLLDLLWHLARRGRGGALRILAMARPPAHESGALQSYAQAIEAEGLCEASTLGPLARDAVIEIAQAELGEARASFLGEQLWRATQGHPLFLGELLRGAARDFRAELATGAEPLPRTIEEAIRKRLDREDSRGLEALRMLAVVEGPANESSLQDLLGGDPAETLARLRARPLLRSTSGGKVDFTHAFVRDAVLRELDAAALRGCHLRWAQYLAQAGARPSERSRHIIAAGIEGEEAREVLLEAASELLGRWRYADAAGCFAAALDRMDPRAPERLAVLERQARAKREARDLEGALGVCREWALNARELNQGAQESRALSVAAACHREAFDWGPALDCAARAVELAETAGDDRVGALAHKTLATVLWETWRHREALEHLEKCLELVGRSGDERALANSFNDVAVPYAAAGRAAAGLDAIHRSRELFEKIGDPVWALVTESNEALILAFLGHGARAVARTRHMIDGLRRMDVGAPVALALENLALLLNRLGHYSGALEAGRELLEAASGSARHENRIAGLLAISEALFQVDERAAASEHARLALELAVALGEERQRLYARLALARDLRASGRLDAAAVEARAVFEEARERRTLRQLIFAALELARVALERNELSEAQRWLDEADAPLDVTSEDAPAIRAAILLERARAWKRQGELEIAHALVAEGLGLSKYRGPAEVEVELWALESRLHEAAGRIDAARRAIVLAAGCVREIASRLEDPVARQRYLARPERASILAAAGRVESSTGVAEALEPGARKRVTLEVLTSLDEVVASAQRRCGAERAALLLACSSTGRVEAESLVGWSPGEIEPLLVALDDLASVVDAEGPLLIRDLAHEDGGRRVEGLEASGVRSLMAAPLPGRERAMLYLDSRAAPSFFDDSDMRVACDLARRAAELAAEREARASASPGTPVGVFELGGMVSRSPLMREVFAFLRRAAASDAPVLILGESGTGKELAARALHQLSARSGETFLSENCVAIPATLLESALFGHDRGAFTGADHGRPGLFELADKGTLLLDEIGELTPDLQAKLLRVLQEGEFRRLGATATRRVDVRVVAATHRDPEELMASGRLREDLYFRLAAIEVRMPPLRERPEDVGLLAQTFLARESVRLGRESPRINPGALHRLARYAWPGNVRELENVVQRLLVLEEGDSITAETLARDPELLLGGSSGRDTETVPSEQADARRRILEALERTGGHREQAAALLGMSRSTLYRRIRALGLRP